MHSGASVAVPVTSSSSSAEECAKDVYKLLAATGLMRPDGEPSYLFSTTGSPDAAARPRRAAPAVATTASQWARVARGEALRPESW